MKRTLLLLPALFLFASCTPASRVGQDLAERLENPLYARKYYAEKMDYMVSLVIQNDPMALDDATADIIDRARTTALDEARRASARELEGARGTFSGPRGEVIGSVLLLDGKLYMGPDFEAVPGVDLRVLLTSDDPQSDAFPDASTVDLGPLKDAFGAHTYAVPAAARDLQRVVLWDSALGRLYGAVLLER